MSKHTPGPWALSEADEYPYDLLIAAGGNQVLSMRRAAHASDQRSLADCLAGIGFEINAEVHSFRRDVVVASLLEQRANARLIAAAPELLAALAAIESEFRGGALTAVGPIPELTRVDGRFAAARAAIAKATT